MEIQRPSTPYTVNLNPFLQVITWTNNEWRTINFSFRVGWCMLRTRVTTTKQTDSVKIEWTNSVETNPTSTSTFSVTNSLLCVCKVYNVSVYCIKFQVLHILMKGFRTYLITPSSSLYSLVSCFLHGIRTLIQSYFV